MDNVVVCNYERFMSLKHSIMCMNKEAVSVVRENQIIVICCDNRELEQVKLWKDGLEKIFNAKNIIAKIGFSIGDEYFINSSIGFTTPEELISFLSIQKTPN